MVKKLTTEEFKLKGREKHGKKYGYGKVIYNGYDEYVKIYCFNHKGYFKQRAGNHIKGKGRGCDQCGRIRGILKRTKTKAKFVEQAIIIHKKKYNYDQSVYINNKTLIKIFCNTCLEFFLQDPRSHLYGHGCSSCAGNKKRTKEEFVKLGKETHIDEKNKPKYGYDNVVYTTRTNKVEILCFICKEPFWQRPHNHIQQKQGCPCCAGNVLKTNKQYIKQCLEVHTDNSNYCQYDYKDCKYINNKNKVKIWCKIDKEFFEQNAYSHLRGHGCPSCSKLKTEKLGRKMIEEITKLKFPSVRPKFLKTEKYKLGLEIDCYNEYYNVGVEFDGLQHEEFVPFFHKTEDKFDDQKIRDSDKDKLCKENKTILVRIPHIYNFKNPTKMYNYIYDQLEIKGILKKIETNLNILLIKMNLE
jgi:hypothetical protein